MHSFFRATIGGSLGKLSSRGSLQSRFLSGNLSADRTRILVVKGQGIGPECIEATKRVLNATGLQIEYQDGVLGYPDAKDLFPLLKEKAPSVYSKKFGDRDPSALAAELEKSSKQEAEAGGNVNDFYKKLLKKLDPEVLGSVKGILADLEKKTLKDAAQSSAVLKGAIRTLDEGDEPSRNVTIRKAFEQYANIRRCVTLDPIVAGIKGADILFVRENVEDLYASIEHRLGRNYPQALRHQTVEGSELICRAAFEAALRDGRKKVTALEKPNILKITGGMFKEVFLRVSKDYPQIKSNFMIIDDGLAAIAATPEKFDVVVTSNMFGDIGSDIAAKVTGGVGLVSSNNTNPSNPKAVSMFETMGGTADDIAGKNLANPLALIDAAAEMLLHIGGKDRITAAELIKTAIMEILAEGYYVGDIKKGEYQESKGKIKLGTQEFADLVAERVRTLKSLKESQPNSTIKQISIQRASEDVKPLFDRVLRSYEQYSKDMEPGNEQWLSFVRRNSPPNPIRAQSRIIGFDMFVDNSGMKTAFRSTGEVDEASSTLDPAVKAIFSKNTGIDISTLFNEGVFGSVQAIRSFGQYTSRTLRPYLDANPQKESSTLKEVLSHVNLGENGLSKFNSSFLSQTFGKALSTLENFDAHSVKLVQAFYIARAREVHPILNRHGFILVRITSRGTEIFPNMCDFEKREVDRYRVEIDPKGPLAASDNNLSLIQKKIFEVQAEVASSGWVISETMLNRNFKDGEGPSKSQEIKGVSIPYAKGLGFCYSEQ